MSFRKDKHKALQLVRACHLHKYRMRNLPCGNPGEVVVGIITDHKPNICQTWGKKKDEKEGSHVGTLHSIEKSYTLHWEA